MEKYGTAGQATDSNTVRRMRIACWITKATDTHSKHLILVSLPRQKWLREGALILRYTYTAHLFRRYFILLKCYVTAHTEQNTHTHTFGKLNHLDCIIHLALR